MKTRKQCQYSYAVQASIGRIRARIGYLMLGCIFVIAVSICIFFNRNYPIYIFLMLFMALIVFLGFLVKHVYLYQDAKLIIDNELLKIPVFSEAVRDRNEYGDLFDQSTNIYISCFGIMSYPKVIKFNLDGIFLEEIIIDSCHIIIKYVDRGKEHILKILYGNIKTDELQAFAERMKYETGILPVFNEDMSEHI